MPVLGPLFALLQASGDGSSDPAFGGGWALSAIAAFFMAAAAIGPRWAWVPLVVSWLLIEGDPAGTLLQPATVVVLGGSLMGRSLRRHACRRSQEAWSSLATGPHRRLRAG